MFSLYWPLSILYMLNRSGYGFGTIYNQIEMDCVSGLRTQLIHECCASLQLLSLGWAKIQPIFFQFRSDRQFYLNKA